MIDLIAVMIILFEMYVVFQYWSVVLDSKLYVYIDYEDPYPEYHRRESDNGCEYEMSTEELKGIHSVVWFPFVFIGHSLKPYSSVKTKALVQCVTLVCLYLMFIGGIEVYESLRNMGG